MVYVGLSEDNESRWNVLKAVTRKMNLDELTIQKLRLLIDRCPRGMSGADFYSWVALAATKAMGRIVEKIGEMSGTVTPDV